MTAARPRAQEASAGPGEGREGDVAPVAAGTATAAAGGRTRAARRRPRAAVRAWRRPAAACIAVAACAWTAGACAQTWRFNPSIGLQETFTNNVDLSPDGARRADWVTQITPGLVLSERGPRTRLDGYIAVPVLLYARTGQDNSNVYPSANVVGDIALVRDFFHVEAAASVAQQFYSPFGGQPTSLDNQLANRYQTQVYRVSPYIASTLSGGTTYELRNDNVWNNLSGTPIAANNSRYSEWIARAENTERALGWRANYDYTDISFSDDTTIRTQLGRFVPIWSVEPQLRLLGSLGYENNDYSLTQSSGAIYGGGLEYRPNERTVIVANYEHRFFGASYLVSFDLRTPLSVWTVRVSRNITTYPQQLASVPVNVDVATFLNSLLLSTIPDAAARQAAVEELMRNRGLPGTLPSAVNLYTQQILLQESQTATVALIGARNSIAFSLYNQKNQQIAASGTPLPPVLGIDQNNTQTGGGVAWTYKLTGNTLLTASANAYQTQSDYSQLPGRTRQAIFQTTLSTIVSPHTTAFVGARYQVLNSNVVPDYNEAAGFVGVAYTFR